MAYLQLLLLLFLLGIKYIAAETTLFHDAILLGVTKDAASLQYTTQLLMGTPQLPTKLVVDLSGQSLWVNCAPSSSSRQFIRHGSLPCSMAKSGCQTTRTGVDHKRTAIATTICDVHQENPINRAANFGDLAEDVVTVDGMGSVATVDRFLFSCAPDNLLKGLASGAKGMLGLGRSKIAFPSQLVNNFDFSRKFTICLSSSGGFIISGTGISRSLSYTPLVSIQGLASEKYYVNVKSIKINGRKLVLHDGGEPIGGVEISTTVPYTTMKSTIYEIFIKAYVKAATSMNMTMVTPMAPFAVCFSSQGMGFGPTVPDIELVLQSEMVKWRIQGRNSMVQVSDAVMCLGFLNGGLDMSSSVVVGGYQLEDKLLEFDLGTRMLGFSSSFLMEGNSCSNIKASIPTPRESL